MFTWFIVLILVNVILWLLVFFLYTQRLRKQQVEEIFKKQIDLVEKENHKLDTIINSIAEGIYVLDQEERFILFNKSAERLLDLPAEEVIGKRERDILDIRDVNKTPLCTTERCQINSFWKKGESHFFKHLYFRNGRRELVPVSLVVSPNFVGGREPSSAVFLFHDISKELEVERTKTEFISVASHQLRTPLNSVKWILEMFKKGDLGRLAKKQGDFVDDAYAALMGMGKLIDDLLRVSNIESGRFQCAPEKVRLKSIFDEVLSTLAYLAKAHNIEMLNDLPGNLPELWTDYKGVRQVMEILLDNAIKYTASGSITISARVNPEDVLFMIQDTGVGIPPEKQDKVFDKFFRAENAAAMHTGGSGLGLYIAKNILEACGGKIWFDSVVGHGTTFYFSLPLRK